MSHRVELGKDARGNLVRIDNALSNMETRLARVQDKLDTLHAQMETAKAELGKPFPQEQELKEKSARLAELNIELNIDDKTPLEAMIDASESAQDTRPAVTAKAERTSVLANTVQFKDWDGRISHANKEWAKTIPVVPNDDSWGGDRNCYFVVDQAHTGLVDLFVTHFRKELEKAPKEKKPSVMDKLAKPLPEAVAKPGKSKEQEL